MNMVKKIFYFILSNFIIKSFYLIIKKILIIFTIFITCGILFHFWLYPKIEENRTLKNTFEYFRFLDKFNKLNQEEKIKFLNEEIANQSNNYKYILYLDRLDLKTMNSEEKLAFFNNLKINIKKLPALMRNGISFDMNLNQDNIKKDDPLYLIQISQEMIKIALEIENLRNDKKYIKQVKNKIKEFHPYIKNNYFLNKVEKMINTKI